MDIDCNNNNKDEHVFDDVHDNINDNKKLELSEELTTSNKLYDRHIMECQKRKENGNEEYRNNNYGRASFEYKIGLSYIQEYEKNILEKDNHNDHANNKEDINETTNQNNNSSNNNPIFDMVQKNKRMEPLNENEKELVKDLLLSLYLNLTQVALKRKQYSKAIEYASHVIIYIDPFHPKALYRRSLAYLNRGDIDASINDLQTLSNHCPDNSDKEIQCLKKLIQKEEQFQLENQRKCYQKMFMN